jgi:hypothetical protein
MIGRLGTISRDIPKTIEFFQKYLLLECKDQFTTDDEQKGQKKKVGKHHTTSTE